MSFWHTHVIATELYGHEFLSNIFLAKKHENTTTRKFK